MFGTDEQKQKKVAAEREKTQVVLWSVRFKSNENLYSIIIVIRDFGFETVSNVLVSCGLWNVG